MQKKRIIVMSTLLATIVLLGIGTIAYFRRTVNGNITGQSGNLVLIVNEVDAVANENFSITLERSETENFILPDDSGSFDLNIDATGSTDNVGVNILISRTNLPDNLNFYLDSNHTKPLSTYGTVIPKSDDMTKTITIYWFWDGSIDDENDSLFINKTISANISVSASIAKSLYETLTSLDSTIDTDVDFGKETFIATSVYDASNNGLFIRQGTQNDEYPIRYYRGDVSNNNVTFADLCWLIVRTTETGGIKLVFNGEVNKDGSCNNYSGVGNKTANENYTDVYAGNTQTRFNESYGSPVYVGYMYNDTSSYFTCTSYEGTRCYAGELDGTGYKAHLADNTIDQTTGRHTQNLYDSNVKRVIDEWYKENILGKPEESLLEDTVWCNDRSVTSTNVSIENFADNRLFGYSALTRLYPEDVTDQVEPSLSCTRDMDKFTVDSANGNGDLDYPIGLLTADERVLGGLSNSGRVSGYLSLLFGSCWTLTPTLFQPSAFNGGSIMFHAGRGISYDSAGDYNGARPSISLANRASIISGNGSFESPYLVG